MNEQELLEKAKQLMDLNLIHMHKAEENIAGAAASILARARFPQKLSKLSSEYKVNLPKGASVNATNTSKNVVADYGNDALRKITLTLNPRKKY